jgi:hypothetical protein
MSKETLQNLTQAIKLRMEIEYVLHCCDKGVVGVS